MTYGVGLAVAMFTTEFCKAFFVSLHWAINLRTAVRLKGAFSSLGFQKMISMRGQSSLSMGEVNAYKHTCPIVVPFINLKGENVFDLLFRWLTF